MLTSTIPVAGIILALFAAAASVTATALTAALLDKRFGPLHVGLLFLPELAGALITAYLLGHLIGKRTVQYLPLAGMGFLAAGIHCFSAAEVNHRAAEGWQFLAINSELRMMLNAAAAVTQQLGTQAQGEMAKY